MIQPAGGPQFEILKRRLIEVTGLAFYSGREEDLASRIARRMEARGAESWAAYTRLLDDVAELDALIGELTIGETYFFRQGRQFDALREVVFPDLAERNQARRSLRIWSAGCATGPEPYSLALLLKRDLAHRFAGWDVRILGTDINREFLARARAGHFGEWAFRSMPEGLRASCFRPSGKSWEIDSQFRQGITFERHNLVRDEFPPPGAGGLFDLILCRNVLIYFSRPVMQTIVARLRECLAEGGWLLVGHAEPNAELFRAFRTVIVHGETVYQKAADTDLRVSVWSGEPSAVGQASACGEIQLAWPDSSQAQSEVRSEPRSARPGSPETGPQAESPAHAEACPTLEEVRRLADRGAWEEASQACQRLVAGNGLDPAPHFLQALIAAQTSRAAEAERSLRRAIFLDRNFVLAHYHLGLLLAPRDPARARRSLENALALLESIDSGRAFPEADGITAAELAGAARLHLEVLTRR